MSLKKASELAEAGIITEAGNAAEYKTGDWRTYSPRFVEENCTHCLYCWIYCPDSAIEVDSSGDKPRMTGINYDHCKGCGICATECPTVRKGPEKAALHMDLEEK